MRAKSTVLVAVLSILGVSHAQARTPEPVHQQAEAQALDLAKASIAMRSVAGPGNRTADVAALYRDALVRGGFAASDVTITPVDDTAYLIARWPGQDPTLKPLVVSGHMDVVEARSADWQRKPFTPIVENGYLYGRGATDMKLDAALALASLIELKREGYKPRRTIVVEFSGDEETAMKTSEAIAAKLRDAEMVINVDIGGGVLDEQTGKPRYFTWTAAEKTYADFRLTVTNPGGHSSAPRKINAINQLSAALVRIGNYRFKPEVNALTRISLASAARYEDPETARAMRAFVADPTDQAAIATLTDNPALIGKIGTTCVATMIDGGHALNALPQHASANVNCRIFPGHTRAAILAELVDAVADPAVRLEDVSEGSIETDASPIRPDLTEAIEASIHAVYPGLPVFPSMASGASDSMWFRHAGVPSYGISPVFLKKSEDFSHGLNERTPIMNIRPAIVYYLALLPALMR